jgi:hypothetical protein
MKNLLTMNPINGYFFPHKGLWAMMVLVFFQACQSGQTPHQYGEEIPNDQQSMNIDQVISAMDMVTDSMEVVVKGKVQKVCKSRGCWLTFQPTQGEVVYVNVVNEAFKLPQSIVGKEILVKGQAYSMDLQKRMELEKGTEADQMNWIKNISIEATGIALVP